jgi:hypothetical protein
MLQVQLQPLWHLILLLLVLLLVVAEDIQPQQHVLQQLAVMQVVHWCLPLALAVWVDLKSVPVDLPLLLLPAVHTAACSLLLAAVLQLRCGPA